MIGDEEMKLLITGGGEPCACGYLGEGHDAGGPAGQPPPLPDEAR